MDERRLVVAGPVAAVVLAGVAGYATGSPAVLGVTPVGVAIYAIVGVATPQYLLARRTEATLRLGLAALATAGGLVALLAGGLGGGVNARWGVDLVAVLAGVVLGVLLSAALREFRAGYRGPD
jgi:hypothetical protein